MKIKSILNIFAFAILLLAQLSFAATVPFPQSVINEMATRQMRYHHYLWHQVREGWNKFPDATKEAFKKIGWEPPRPARSYDANGVASAILDNYSGEDFLYMHRDMIATVNAIITKNKDPYGKIKGWTTVPAPGDAEFPVPANYTIPNNTGTTSSTTTRKTDNFYKTIQKYEKMFKDPVQLRNMTLGQLGAQMEVTIHAYMHMRWSSSSELGYRNTYKGTIPFIDRKWDNVTYDWLGDTYGSHVHPLFWKIHGWIDDRIEDWRKANNLTSIKWKGTWTGGPMSNLTSVMKTTGMNMSSDGANNDMGVLEEAFKILQDSGIEEVSVSDPVKCDGLPFFDDEESDQDQEEVVQPPKKVCKVRKAAL